MKSSINFLDPTHQKSNGITLGFILSCFFCGNFNSDLNRIKYIFLYAGWLNWDSYRKQYHCYDEDFLLKKMFNLTFNEKFISSKELREIMGFKTNDTFRKHFKKVLISFNNEKAHRKAFTLEETYCILKIWQGENKIGRIKAYTKEELAKQFTNDNISDLKFEMIDAGIMNNKEFKSHKISPINVRKLAEKIYLNQPEKLEQFYEDDSDYLEFLFYLFLANKVSKKFQSTQ